MADVAVEEARTVKSQKLGGGPEAAGGLEAAPPALVEAGAGAGAEERNGEKGSPIPRLKLRNQPPTQRTTRLQ